MASISLCGPALVLAPWAFSPQPQPPLGFLELFSHGSASPADGRKRFSQFFAHVLSYLLGNVVNLTQGVHGSTHTSFSFISKQ